MTINKNFQYKFLMSREEAVEHRLEARKNLGTYLNEYRRNQGLNLVDVSDSLSIRLSTLDDYENGIGNISIDRLMYICRFYGVVLKVSLQKVDGINYDRSEEHEQARIYQANRPKEICNVK